MRKAPTKMTASRALYTLQRAMKEHLLDREFGVDEIRLAVEYFEEAGIAGCIYCGSVHIERWDHLVPTRDGGATVLGNMVPACQPCDDSKGPKDYRTWLAGSSRKNPARGNAELFAAVVSRVEAYQSHFGYEPPESFHSALDSEQQTTYREFQQLLASIRTQLARFGLIELSVDGREVAEL